MVLLTAEKWELYRAEEAHQIQQEEELRVAEAMRPVNLLAKIEELDRRIAVLEADRCIRY